MYTKCIKYKLNDGRAWEIWLFSFCLFCRLVGERQKQMCQMSEGIKWFKFILSVWWIFLRSWICRVVVFTLAGNRVTQGNFTLTFPRNRAWKSPFTRLFLFNHKCINTLWTYQFPVRLLAVILFHNNQSSHFCLLFNLKHKQAKSFAPLPFSNFITTTA